MNNSEGLGIVAKTPDALDRIELALVVKWAVEDTVKYVGTDALRRVDAGSPGYQIADNQMDESVPRDVYIRIDTPLAPHSAMEPRIAVVDLGRGGGRIWVGTKDPFLVATCWWTGWVWPRII